LELFRDDWDFAAFFPGVFDFTAFVAPPPPLVATFMAISGAAAAPGIG
jgi:hypothetical protein